MTHRCSLCGKAYEFEYTHDKHIGSFPFCSERCKMIDLGKWLDEEYKLSTPMPELDAMTDDERRLMVQYLLDAGLVDAVSEDDSDTVSEKEH